MILLILLGIIMFVLLLVLIVPIRYRLFVHHGEELLVVRGRVNWLLHLIHASILWEDETKLHITVRVFGFLLYDNLRVKKVVKTKIKKTKNKKIKNKETKIIKRKKKKPLARKKEKRNKKTEVIEAIKKDDIELLNQLNDTIHKNEEEAPMITDETLEQVNHDTFYKEERGEADNFDDSEEENSFIRKIYLKLKRIMDKVIEFFKRIKRRIIHIINTIEKIMTKKDLLLKFLHNEMNKEGFRITWSSLKKLIKHIMPTKLKSSVIFGTGDPCSTGQALGAISIIYSFYGDKVKIIPDFENKRFDGTHDARGRLRSVTILIIVIKLVMDKRFKELKRNVKILKEAL